MFSWKLFDAAVEPDLLFSCRKKWTLFGAAQCANPIFTGRFFSKPTAHTWFFIVRLCINFTRAFFDLGSYKRLRQMKFSASRRQISSPVHKLLKLYCQDYCSFCLQLLVLNHWQQGDWNSSNNGIIVIYNTWAKTPRDVENDHAWARHSQAPSLRYFSLRQQLSLQGVNIWTCKLCQLHASDVSFPYFSIWILQMLWM